VFGTEAFVVLKDIWGLDRKRAEEVALWTCHALIQAAVATDTQGKIPAAASRGLHRNGARRTSALLAKRSRVKLKK
jgi:hypothetical protein